MSVELAICNVRYMQPCENASCERAFSIMKFIKNKQRSCLSQLHLDNALRIGLETREPSDFPFEQLFHYTKN